MNDTGYEAVAQNSVNTGYKPYDPAEGIFNMVLNESLRSGIDVDRSIAAATKAVTAYRDLFAGN